MKKSILLLAAATGFLLTTMWSANAYNGKFLNGKAVSVQYRWGDSWTVSEAMSPWRGSLLLYTIKNSQVTHVDTIYKREQAFSHYAAFNFSGTKIAFYRLGQALSGNALAPVNGGKSYISIINPDGTGLTDLCELPAFPTKAEMSPSIGRRAIGSITRALTMQLIPITVTMVVR